MIEVTENTQTNPAKILLQAFAVGLMAGFSINSFINFIIPIFDKMQDIPNKYPKENPVITNSEMIEKFINYNEVNFKTTLMFTFIGLGLATIVYAFVIKPFWQNRNIQEIPDGAQASSNTPTTSENLKQIAKSAGLGVVVGGSLAGSIIFFRNMFLRNYPKGFEENFTVVNEIIRVWTRVIDFNLIFSGLSMLAGMILLITLNAHKPIRSLFFRNNNPEGTPLVSNQASQAAPEPSVQPALIPSHATL